MSSYTFNNPDSTSNYVDKILNLITDKEHKTSVVHKSIILNATIHIQERYLFFWMGPLSQWAPATFRSAILDEEVNCAEQAMMLYKALYFGDNTTYTKILDAKTPHEQLKLGRQVCGFNQSAWDKVKRIAVNSINYDKFTQLPEYMDLLLLTYPYELVEASPMDRIWGIGFGEDNTDILKRKHEWGENLLGKALMDVRSKILNRYENIKNYEV